MFEAGALSKSMKTSHVCPLVFDMELNALSGPVAQFQSNILNRAGVKNVLTAINASLEGAKLDDSHLAEQLEMLWPRLEKELAAMPAAPVPTPQKESPAPTTPQDVSVLLDIINDLRKMNTVEEPAFTLTVRHGTAQYATTSVQSVVYAPISTMEGAIQYVDAQWEQITARVSDGNRLLELITEVAEDVDLWRNSHFKAPVVAIDLSYSNLEDPLIDSLVSLGLQYRNAIEVGVSEEHLVDQSPEMRRRVQRLAEGGLLIGVRDFGVGVASVEDLERAPINSLWIVEGLLGDISESENAKLMAVTMVGIADRLNVRLIADGVHTATFSAELSKQGIRIIKEVMAGDTMPPSEVYKRLAD